MKLINTFVLCEQLGVSRQTVWSWRKEGMPYIQIKKFIRFDYDRVLDWLEKRSRENQ